MRTTLRWQIFLALLGFSLIFAILAFQVEVRMVAEVTPVVTPNAAGGELCTGRVPLSGGVYTDGMLGAPQSLNPLLSDLYPVDRELVNLIFDGLTRIGEDGRPQPNLAGSWNVAEDGRTIRFLLRPDVQWHDGVPVSAADVIFTYSLLQEEGFPGQPAVKSLWQTVEMREIDAQTVEFVLSEPYAPFLEATTRGILPAHLLADVTVDDLASHPFNQAPVGTGPWMAVSGQNWRQSGQLQLQPNPAYFGAGAFLEGMVIRFYPTEEALLAAFAAGEIQGVPHVSAEMLPQLAALPDVRMVTTAAQRYSAVLFNLSETGATALQETAVRRALALALDREKLVDAAFNGQGILFNGPFLPGNWANRPDVFTPLVADPISATLTLEEAGWLLPAGETVRQREEEFLDLQILTLAAAPNQEAAAAMAAQWAEVGVGATVSAVSGVEVLRDRLAARDFDVALVEITPRTDPDLYDFWSQEAIIRGQNYAGWNNRRASEALENGRQLWSVADRRPYYETFLRIFANELPALTLYQHVDTAAFSDAVFGMELGQINSPRERYATYPVWHFDFEIVYLPCPAAE